MKIATEASREFFDWALLDALHIEQANPDPHLDDLQLLHALEQREDEEGVCDRSWNEHGNASTYLRASAWSSLEVGTPSATNVFFALGDGRIILMLCVFYEREVRSSSNEPVATRC